MAFAEYVAWDVGFLYFGLIATIYAGWCGRWAGNIAKYISGTLEFRATQKKVPSAATATSVREGSAKAAAAAAAADGADGAMKVLAAKVHIFCVLCSFDILIVWVSLVPHHPRPARDRVSLLRYV